MKDSKKDILIRKIINNIKNLDVAWYLKQEVQDFLKYLHYYKLKNILQNADALSEYLIYLDKKNTDQICGLDHNINCDLQKTQDNLYYYISKKWLNEVWKEKINQKIWENDYNLISIMQWLKWFLLLTADEFCNASQTRMFINKIIRQKENILNGQNNKKQKA